VRKSTSILIVDDHEIVRELLRSRLQFEPDLKVVGHVGDANAAIAQAVSLQPDIILMDIDMPGVSCFDAAARIASRCPNTRLIFLTALVKDRYIEEALAVHAWGYITKSEPPESILKAIRNVAEGITYFSPAVQARIVVGPQGAVLAHKDQTLAASLTPREREVLCYLAQGKSKKTIAEMMSLSVKTVEFHCTHIMEKLKIHDRVELARFAIREGLVEA
jgi:DNA-binding NarL/FixJ family response regulator